MSSASRWREWRSGRSGIGRAFRESTLEHLFPHAVDLMKKYLLGLSALISMAAIAPFSAPANAAEAHCVVKETASETIRFSGECDFQQFGGDGSFSIQSLTGLIDGRVAINVYMIEPGVAEVRGLTTDGINSRWGTARRSDVDRACWVGSDFTICAY